MGYRATTTFSVSGRKATATAAAAYFAVTWWYIRGALAVLPLIAWAFFLSVCERRHEALAEEPETIPDSSAHPTSNA